LVAVIAVVAIAAVAYLAIRYPNPKPPCCAPEPLKGQLFLKSYNFQTTSSPSTLFAVFGIFEGQNVTLQQVFFDQTQLTRANSGLNATCGMVKIVQYYADECTISFSFGPSLPAPSAGSTHVLKVVASTGVTSSFQVTAGYLYEATSTAAYPTVTVNGTVYQGCVGSGPVGVAFKDEGGNSFTTNVSYANNSWTYSISLLNGHTYSVAVSYKPVVPNPPTQTASVGTLTLDVESPTYTYNISC